MIFDSKPYLFGLAISGLLLVASGRAQTPAAGDTPPDDAGTAAVEPLESNASLPQASGPPADFRSEDLDRDYVEPPSARDSAEQDLLRFFGLYKDALVNSSFDEADTLAKQIIEISIQLYGLDSYDSARALTNLGIVQHKREDYESAQLNFQAAIDIIERIGDRLNAELIFPLKGLGATQLAAGRPDLARKTFRRAVHISQVNEGPHNLAQVELLDALTETYLSVGEVDEALGTLEAVYNLQARRADMKSEDALVVLQRQANWMHRLQYYNRERIAYRQMVRIIEKQRGKKDLSLIGPLTGLGNSYLYTEPYEDEYQTYQPASGGEAYLKRALRIAEGNENSDWQVVRDALLALGDFYTLATVPNRAKRSYGDVWRLLSEPEDRLPSRRESLQTAHILQTISPRKYYNSARTDDGRHVPDSFERGTIVVGFTVTEYGHPTGISLIEAQPPGLEKMENAVLREVRDLRYRPQLRAGRLVRVPDMTYTHEFFYRPSDLPKDNPEAATDEAQPERSPPFG